MGLLIAGLAPVAFLPTREHSSFLSLALDFFMQMLPALAVLAATLLGWKWKRAGGFLFFFLGTSYILMAWGSVHISAFFVITGPLYLIGTLFLLGRTTGSGED